MTKIPGNPCIYILKRLGPQKDNHEPIKGVLKALNPIDLFSEKRLIIFRAFPFLSGKNPTRLSPVLASLQVSSLQTHTHAQTTVYVNVAQADEFKPAETYLLSSQT